MTPRTLARRLTLLTVLPSSLALAACGGAAASAGPPSAAVGAAAVTRVVVPSADRFRPFAIVVRKGTQVTFHNGDADRHSVVTTPGDPGAFNEGLAPGASWTVTLMHSGVYQYYCSIHARYDPATGQVEALPSADHPAEPMQGLIIVH